ncbi:MAG: hypothetical protein J6A50_04420 [Clostridia bacterium]|nr:hypothetical protein [Clostridia bacterium]
MIPKKIHYCWFGHNEKPEIILKCIESWKKFCPDYEIIEWNEDNIDVHCCPYSSRAYKEKRWGYVPDPLRFKIIYENGGVYLDTDAELIAPIDEYLQHKAFFGYATATEIGSGLGFGGEQGNPFIKTMMDHYFNLPENCRFQVSTEMETPIFKREYPEFYGDKWLKKDQILGDDILIIWDIWKFEIHHYTGTWQTPLQRIMNKSKFLKWLNKCRKKLLSKKR